MKTSEIIAIVAGIVIIILSIVSFTEEAQQVIPDEETIVGTWIPEGSPHNSLVISQNNIAKKYINDNELYKTFNWTIEIRYSPSGLKFPILILTNVNDPDDVYEYLIDTLTEDRLVLVYNTGIGPSRIPYTRQ